MALEVVWADRALVKLGEILERISEDRPAVATRVINRMFDMAATLAAHPEMGRQYEPAPGSGLRQLIVGRYGLIHRIERRRLAVSGKLLGRKILGEVAGIVSPDTILRW